MLNMYKSKQKVFLLVIMFVVYLLVLIKIVIFKNPVDFTFIPSFFSINSNFIPFKTILSYLSGIPTWRIAITNLVGNIFLFAPLGALLPLIFNTITWKYVIVLALVFSTLLECTQIFFVGSPDIDDVLLNALGAFIGYGAFRLFQKVISLGQVL